MTFILGGQSAFIPRLWLQIVQPWAKTVAQGASTTLYGAFSPALGGGEYLEDCDVSYNTHPYALDPLRAQDLWDFIEANFYP